MPVEFLGMGATNDGTETRPRSGPAFDPEYTVALARAHEENGWDRVLTAYGSGSPDPAQAAALHRLPHRAPADAARAPAERLLPHVRGEDHRHPGPVISGGRLTVHVITGGNDHEQQREGDTLTKDRRYDRTREYIQIVKKAWTSREPFDLHGEHYRFSDFVLDVEPVQKPRPRISFGGSSAAAYQVGAEEADIYALWGEPLAGTAEQIAHDHASWPRPRAARRRRSRWRSGRSSAAPRTRPGRRPTPPSPASRTGRRAARRAHPPPQLTDPENAGSQRLLAIAEQGERYDRALWTVTAKATGGAGNSTALVGTPETVAAALLDYYDLGVRILSARGYDLLEDAIEFGRDVIPLVRAEVAKRDAAERASIPA